jgi:hypothetical protein
MPSVSTGLKSIESFDNHEQASLTTSKFGIGNDVKFLFGVDHKISIANISCINIQVIKLSKKHAKSEESESNNARINAVFARCSHVATRNQVRLATHIMFYIKNKEVDTEALLMIAWRLCTSPQIVKSVVFINMIHFNTNRSLPKLVVIVFINS